jgi:hypothetical protein
VGKVRPDKGLLLALGAERQAAQYRKIIGRIRRFRATRVCCMFPTAAQIGCTYRAVPFLAFLKVTQPGTLRHCAKRRDTPGNGGFPFFSLF